ncbi:hypothetical protein ACE4Z6_28100, partial [Salmonella enterica]|uniref:hypothetical protein n=1 Tax=Salmonella enterica TaxID=28901 RepID=UPI003D29F589
TEDIVIPMPAFAAAVAWLGKAAPAGLAVLPPPAARNLVLANGVIEQVVRFERAGVFFGVLCRPPRSPRKDCVLILN